MSEGSLRKPPQIVVGDSLDSPLSSGSQPDEGDVREILVSLEEPPPTLLWLGLLGYLITFAGSFMVADFDLALCFNILCGGSFFSTLSLMIYYTNYGNWEANTGKSNTNANATLLGIIAVFIMGLYIFFIAL
tara:strand:+ start:1686 stop:2081 length:396 start_codon:yes stop_codon:yes gene_type:complete